MSSMKYGMIAVVIIAIVAGGYYMAKRKAAKNGGRPINSPKDALDALADTIRGKDPDAKFARTKDGKVDYSRKADGTPIMFT